MRRPLFARAVKTRVVVARNRAGGHIMGYTTLLLERTGAIATLTLNRPDARNALDLVMRGELLSALDEVEADPEARVVILTGGGTWLLSRVVGLARAKELIFTAEIIEAAEAHRIGLVNRVVKAADLAAETQALAERIATGPPLALRLAKQMVNRAATSDLASA